MRINMNCLTAWEQELHVQCSDFAYFLRVAVKMDTTTACNSVTLVNPSGVDVGRDRLTAFFFAFPGYSER